MASGLYTKERNTTSTNKGDDERMVKYEDLTHEQYFRKKGKKRWLRSGKYYPSESSATEDLTPLPDYEFTVKRKRR